MHQAITRLWRLLGGTHAAASVLAICQECCICISAVVQVCVTIEKDSRDDNSWLKYLNLYLH